MKISFVFIFLIVVVGAIVNNLFKVASGKIDGFKLRYLFLDLILSFLIALIVFSICKGFQIDEWLTAGLIGMSVKRELGFFSILENLFFKLIGKG